MVFIPTLPLPSPLPPPPLLSLPPLPFLPLPPLPLNIRDNRSGWGRGSGGEGEEVEEKRWTHRCSKILK